MIKIISVYLLLLIGVTVIQNIQSEETTEVTPIECPTNQTYRNCSLICPPRCTKVKFVCLIRICGQPKCQCSDGYLLNGHKCIKLEDCQYLS